MRIRCEHVAKGACYRCRAAHVRRRRASRTETVSRTLAAHPTITAFVPTVGSVKSISMAQLEAMKRTRQQ